MAEIDSPLHQCILSNMATTTPADLRRMFETKTALLKIRYGERNRAMLEVNAIDRIIKGMEAEIQELKEKLIDLQG